jgi:hypothetical protein
MYAVHLRLGQLSGALKVRSREDVLHIPRQKGD